MKVSPDNLLGEEAATDHEKMEQVAKIIDKHVKNKKPLLLTCVIGMERSPLEFAYWLVTRRGMTIPQAYQYLQHQRPIVADRSFWVPE